MIHFVAKSNLIFWSSDEPYTVFKKGGTTTEGKRAKGKFGK
jgi:hypothetical protein